MVKKILLTALLFVFIFIDVSMTVLAAEDVEWVEKLSASKLYWGDSVTVEDYIIKAEDFSNDSVFISVSKDGEKLKTYPLSTGMDIVHDDKIKVYAKKIDPNYDIITANGKEFKTKSSNPYAELSISLPGQPSLNIQVETEKDTYDSKSLTDEKIDVSINVKNDGEAEAKDIVMIFDTAGLELLKGKAEYKNTKLLKGEALKPINLTLKTSAPWEDTDFNLTARITCIDVKNKKYHYEGSKIVKVEKKWEIFVSKAFSKNCNVGESIPVSVTLRNAGLCDLNKIFLNDSVASGMHLQENTTLNITLSLKSGEKAEKILKYSLIPEKSGEFTLPQCVATFTLPNGQRKEVSSNNSDVVKISGSDITVIKKVDKQQLNTGDTLNVTVTAQNNGTVSVNVKMNDTLPPGARLLRGETSSKQILKSGGGSMSINYTLQMNNEGEFTLPACKAKFYDLSENSGEVSSDTPAVHVRAPISLEENNTKAEGSTKTVETNRSNRQENNLSGEENKSSDQVQNGSTTKDSEITPGFDFAPAVAGFLVVTWLRIKRSV